MYYFSIKVCLLSFMFECISTHIPTYLYEDFFHGAVSKFHMVKDISKHMGLFHVLKRNMTLDTGGMKNVTYFLKKICNPFHNSGSLFYPVSYWGFWSLQGCIFSLKLNILWFMFDRMSSYFLFISLVHFTIQFHCFNPFLMSVFIIASVYFFHWGTLYYLCLYTCLVASYLFP